MDQHLKQKIGARILSEANDLKRTIPSMAKELGFSVADLQLVVKGEAATEDIVRVIDKMGEKYPIDHYDLYLLSSDHTHGVVYFSAEKSRLSHRIFNRFDRHNDRTPYYEYRDTAMSKHAPFKPEWIKELRVVDSSDPNHPDVAYNNGHLMHQMTFFIGPVNFYWAIDDKKYVQEMNTGDSNYITPFVSHSFTSRDETQDAIIIAITFGGNVRRALKEIYGLGHDQVQQYQLDFSTKNKGISDLILFHFKNENLTLSNVKERCQKLALNLDLDAILDPELETSFEDLLALASVLNVELCDLLGPFISVDPVVVHFRNPAQWYGYPNSSQQVYQIHPLARSAAMPLMKGFDIHIQQNEPSDHGWMSSSLHGFIYNYGDSDITMTWRYRGDTYHQCLCPEDSLYIQPFLDHQFSNNTDSDGKLCMCRVSGGLNLETQREMSRIGQLDRISQESKCWFDS